MSGLSPLLSSSRCLVAVGPGGVGKTSTSAALAIEAARRGQRAVVLTIDPARRLANALGLPEIGSVETDVRPEAFARVGLEPPAGRLTAMMLDIREAWDDVVTRYHPDPEGRERLLRNRLYHALSTALAGSQEYMAMEKLHRLSTREEDRPDIIVLDTPPATHALDFLEAPNRIVDALDNDATRWLLEPYRGRKRLSRRVFDTGSSVFVRTVARLTGVELLEELAELLGAFSAMFDGFRERARTVKALLAREDTQFLVVGSPSRVGLADVRGFVERLDERQVHVGAVIVNRCAVDPFETRSEAPQVLRAAIAAAGGPEDLALRLEENAREAAARARLDHEGAVELASELGGKGARSEAGGPPNGAAPARPVLRVPELRRDVHDLESLEHLRSYLFERSRPAIPGG